MEIISFLGGIVAATFIIWLLKGQMNKDIEKDEEKEKQERNNKQNFDNYQENAREALFDNYQENAREALKEAEGRLIKRIGDEIAARKTLASNTDARIKSFLEAAGYKEVTKKICDCEECGTGIMSTETIKKK